ncbi:unnamed protein product [Penicillium pancosmium]
MSSEPGDDSMSFAYPAHVSRDALRSISTVSFDALVAHGPGMLNGSQDGLFQIRKRLIDSNLMLVPVLEPREVSELHYDEDESINDNENISHNGPREESSFY